MNQQETQRAAQLQIRRLYAHSDPAEREKIKKCLRPLISHIKPQRRCSEPIHVRYILPEIMDDIGRRMERAGVRV